ncbi:MAG: hypothetical protein RPR97_18665 [Colwellia sp.]
MTINDEILVLANQLANKGKKPTIALIKAKLTKNIPLPTIISTLKAWQHDPSYIVLPQSKMEVNSGSSASNTINVETESLRKIMNSELTQIKQEIVELKELIHQLLAQQNPSIKK